jgi:four helix bundle protein
MMMTEKRKYDLEERLLEYSVIIIRLVDSLPKSMIGNIISDQLLRSGTSPLSNHGEAQSAESTNDFIHKLKICLKELRETKRWTLLIKRVPLPCDITLADMLLNETEELIKIFAKSVDTANKNRK